MRIRFWGTRGSLPTPGPTTLRYGGNTPCVEVRADDGTLIVLDAGSGAHALGRAILARPPPTGRGHLLLTHMHWDHIQGFPFFAPLRVAGQRWDVYAPQGLGERLEAVLAGQMEYTYFPVALADLDATVRYHELVEQTLEAGGVTVRTQYLNHPALTLGYRLTRGGVSFVYSTDHEPHSRHQPESTDALARGAARPIHREDRRHVDFLAGADLVIHDAAYTLAEYPQKLGWGHSPAELTVDWAIAAGVRRLALFHHDPLRDDDAVDRVVELCRRRVAATGADLDVFAAVEGAELDLGEERRPTAAGAADPPGGAAPVGELPVRPVDGAIAHATVLLVDDDESVLRVLSASLETEGLNLLEATDGNEALAIARAERPALILLDWRLPFRDGLEVCRALRADADPSVRDVPIVLVTGRTDAADLEEGFAAGATDYLVKPFSPAQIRSRVRAWLLRGRREEP